MVIKKLALGFSLLFSINAFSNTCIKLKNKETESYSFKTDIKIRTFDKLHISANLLTPKNSPREKFPTIIFVNSWLMDENEYLRPATKLAEKGYQVLSYSTRGWGCSGGKINVLGPNDMDDLKRVIDWLEENTKVDIENIGMSGISYGGGMTLMGLAHEKRLKTGVAMSAWGSLAEALYGSETPRLFWGSFLVTTGWLLGELDDDIPSRLNEIILHKNVKDNVAWAIKRSPVTYIENINKRNAPVFIANNFGDNLFQPTDIINYYNKLTVPKRLDLNQGMHATGEMGGLFGDNNYSFNAAIKWFDYWLMGEENGIMNGPSLTIETDVKHDREEYDAQALKNMNFQKLYLTPRSAFKQGGLSKKAFSKKSETDTILSGNDSNLTTGIPLLSALIDGNLSSPVWAYLPFTKRLNGIVYKTIKLEKDMRIRGIPKIKVNLNQGHTKSQLIAYLYDMDKYGNARLITHGVRTIHQAKKRESLEVDLSMVATAYDIEAGHKLVLAFDTFDMLYASPTLVPYTINFEFNKKNQSYLEIPTL